MRIYHNARYVKVLGKFNEELCVTVEDVILEIVHDGLHELIQESSDKFDSMIQKPTNKTNLTTIDTASTDITQK